MASFAERLRKLREEHNWSTRQLSKLTGISHSAITYYEMGERNPKREALEAIADTFNVDMDYLLGNSDIRNRYRFNLQIFGNPEQLGETEKKLPPEPKLSEEEKEMLDIFRLIPDDMQRVFLEMGRAYANSLKKE